MAARTKFRAIGFRLVLLGFGLLIAFLLGELTLRLFTISFPMPYIPNLLTGSRLQPGWSGWFTKEGRAFVVVNQQGYRDRNHATVKPRDTLRILVLGDSYVEAVQVATDETFWSVMEKQLQSRLAETHKQVEVLAMGVSGWGTAQELLALEHEGLAYAPDVVVVAFTSTNDLRNNSKQLEPDAVRPFFVLRDNELQLDDSFRQHPQFIQGISTWTRFKVAVINHSRIAQALQEQRSRWKYRGAVQQSGAGAGLDDQCFFEPRDKAWLEAWEVTEQLLVRMQQLCQQHQAQFCVAIVNSSIQVHPDRAVRESFREKLGVDKLDYADKRIQQLGASHSFPVFVLSSPLRQFAEEHKAFVHGFANTEWGTGHWNKEGHRLVGEYLAEQILPLVSQQ